MPDTRTELARVLHDAACRSGTECRDDPLTFHPFRGQTDAVLAWLESAGWRAPPAVDDAPVSHDHSWVDTRTAEDPWPTRVCAHCNAPGGDLAPCPATFTGPHDTPGTPGNTR